MDFDLGDTAEALRSEVARFSANEIAPRAADIDIANEFPADLWRKFGDLGLLGITADKDYGGANNRRQTLQTVQDERCTTLYGVPTMFITQLDSPASRASILARSALGLWPALPARSRLCAGSSIG